MQRVPAAALADRGLKRHYKDPEPCKILHRGPAKGQADQADQADQVAREVLPVADQTQEVQVVQEEQAEREEQVVPEQTDQAQPFLKMVEHL